MRSIDDAYSYGASSCTGSYLKTEYVSQDVVPSVPNFQREVRMQYGTVVSALNA